MLFFAIFLIKEFLLPHPVWRLGQKSFIKFRKLFGQWSLTYSDQIGCIPSSSFPEIPHGDPLIEIVFTRRSKFLWIVQFTDSIKALLTTCLGEVCQQCRYEAALGDLKNQIQISNQHIIKQRFNFNQIEHFHGKNKCKFWVSVHYKCRMLSQNFILLPRLAHLGP